MNAAQVIILKGVGESGLVTWEVTPEGGGDPIENHEIYCNGGFYWLLANITINDPQTMFNQTTFTWSLDKLTPQNFTLETRQHVHQVGFGDSGLGPRLLYQNPVQFWTFGQIEKGTLLYLECSTDCTVELVAIRHSIMADIDTMALELR